MHCTVCILLYVVYSMNSILCIIFYALYLVHYILHICILSILCIVTLKHMTDEPTDRHFRYRAGISAQTLSWMICIVHDMQQNYYCILQSNIISTCTFKAINTSWNLLTPTDRRTNTATYRAAIATKKRLFYSF